MSTKRNFAAHLGFLLLTVGAMGIASGCGSSTSTNPIVVPEKMYLTLTGGVEVFPLDAKGNVAPTTTITNATTPFVDARRVAFDASGKMYVTDAGSDSVVVFAGGATGAATPVATISGANTNLNFPIGIAVDSQGNIYVANTGDSNASNPPPGNTITIFAAGATGNVAPTKTIAGANTLLNYPSDLTLDSHGNIYVINETGPNFSVTVFPAGSSGNATPSTNIVGLTNTGLNQPLGVAVDSSGKIYVTNAQSGNPTDFSVTVFAAGATGDVAPVDTITGATSMLTGPDGIAVDAAGNIYVVNNDLSNAMPPNNNLLVFPVGSNGNVAPSTVLGGASTGLAAGSIHGVTLH